MNEVCRIQRLEAPRRSSDERGGRRIGRSSTKGQRGDSDSRRLVAQIRCGRSEVVMTPLIGELPLDEGWASLRLLGDEVLLRVMTDPDARSAPEATTQAGSARCRRTGSPQIERADQHGERRHQLVRSGKQLYRNMVGAGFMAPLELCSDVVWFSVSDEGVNQPVTARSGDVIAGETPIRLPTGRRSRAVQSAAPAQVWRLGRRLRTVRCQATISILESPLPPLWVPFLDGPFAPPPY